VEKKRSKHFCGRLSLLNRAEVTKSIVIVGTATKASLKKKVRYRKAFRYPLLVPIGVRNNHREQDSKKARPQVKKKVEVEEIEGRTRVCVRVPGLRKTAHSADRDLQKGRGIQLWRNFS